VPGQGGDDGRGPGIASDGSGRANAAFAVPESPIGLTASDGTGLRLLELRAEAVIDGPLAFTELHLSFENPLDRTLEGTFRIALPQNASLGRFAMKIGEQWQEGEVVELAEARRAYEDFLHRKQDPALMEKSSGNEFSARVFPIPARGIKEIVVSYESEIQDGAFVLPLRGLPELGVLDVKASVVGAKGDPQRLTAQRTTPSADFVVDRARTNAPASATHTGIRNGELAILRVKPQSETKPDAITAAVVLVDTSASRTLGFEKELEIVKGLVKRLSESQATVTVAAFDQTVVQVFDGRAADFSDADLAKLRERGPLGASDLGKALAWTKEQAKKSGKKRVVLVGDGVPTAGDTDPKKLVADVAALKDAGVERMDALAIGGIRDDAGMLRLLRGQLARDGIVADVAADAPAALRRIAEATRSNVPVRVEGATWSWPQKLDGVQAGDAYSIYVDIPEGRPIKVTLDGKPIEITDLRKTERPLVERAVSQAKIASMLERETTTKEDMKKSIVSLATQHRIMTPYTAMLVLETEQDYARFHIDRKSLRDVLAVDGGRVKRIHRTDFTIPKAVPLDVDAVAEREQGREEGYGYDFSEDPLSAGGAGNSANRPVDSAATTSSADRKSAEKKPMMNAPARTANASPPPPPASPPPRAAATAAPPREAPKPEPAPRAPARGEATAGKAARAPSTNARQPMGDPSSDATIRVRPGPVAVAPRPSRRAPSVTSDGDGISEDLGGRAAPYEGKLLDVMTMLKSKRTDEALASARAWQREAPGDVLALVAVGEAAEAKANLELAARAYGSVIDLFPNRADLRRFAGERLERIADPSAQALAIDSFEKALADRPDHPSSHRLFAFSLLRAKKYKEAFEAVLAATKRGFEVDRFAGVDQILREDLGLVGSAWARAEPGKRGEILARVQQAGGRIEDQPSLRFVLDWQTDSNDVDFHIHDAQGGHAFYGSRHLPSGGDLYADVTTGYGPECFTIRLPKERRSSYRLEAHYYSRGPMGYGMGKLEVIDHDGKGNLVFEERPFVVMVDRAFVDLGAVR